MDIESFLRANPGMALALRGYRLFCAGEFWVITHKPSDTIIVNVGFQPAFERWLELTGATLPVY